MLVSSKGVIDVSSSKGVIDFSLIEVRFSNMRYLKRKSYRILVIRIELKGVIKLELFK